MQVNPKTRFEWKRQIAGETTARLAAEERVAEAEQRARHAEAELDRAERAVRDLTAALGRAHANHQALRSLLRSLGHSDVSEVVHG